MLLFIIKSQYSSVAYILILPTVVLVVTSVLCVSVLFCVPIAKNVPAHLCFLVQNKWEVLHFSG